MTTETTTEKSLGFSDGFLAGLVFAWIVAPLILSFITLGVPGGPANLWFTRCFK